MVKTCSVVNCPNRYISKKLAESGVKKKYKAYKNIPFHTLPVEEERRIKWIAFINRKPGTLPKEVYVCGEHFELGRKSNDSTHTDYIPTIPAKPELTTTTTTTQSTSSSSCTPSKSKRKTPKKTPSKLHSASSSLKRTMRHKKILMARLNNPKPKQNRKKKNTLPQEDELLVIDNTTIKNQDDDPAALKEKIKKLEGIILNKNEELLSSKRKINTLTTANRHMKERIEKLIKYNHITNLKLIETRNTLREQVFLINNDTDKMKFYTGIPSFEIFEQVFNFIKDHVDRDENSTKLTHKQEFMIVLMRLRVVEAGPFRARAGADLGLTVGLE